MFERYTQEARRALFFSRYEASRLGRPSIETEHLLLALLRGRSGLLDRLFIDHRLNYDDIASTIQSGSERLATSVEIPFTEEMKQVLISATKEADRFANNDVEGEHLLLGLLHENDSVAGRILSEHGLELDATRIRMASMFNERRAKGARTERDELLELVDTIELIAGDLASPPGTDSGVSRALIAAIQQLRRRLEERGR
jgi:ATP-dependent Clp protease ATP-binding subunit ClpA